MAPSQSRPIDTMDEDRPDSMLTTASLSSFTCLSYEPSSIDGQLLPEEWKSIHSGVGVDAPSMTPNPSKPMETIELRNSEYTTLQQALVEKVARAEEYFYPALQDGPVVQAQPVEDDAMSLDKLLEALLNEEESLLEEELITTVVCQDCLSDIGGEGINGAAPVAAAGNEDHVAERLDDGAATVLAADNLDQKPERTEDGAAQVPAAGIQNQVGDDAAPSAATVPAAGNQDQVAGRPNEWDIPYRDDIPTLCPKDAHLRLHYDDFISTNRMVFNEHNERLDDVDDGDILIGQSPYFRVHRGNVWLKKVLVPAKFDEYCSFQKNDHDRKPKFFYFIVDEHYRKGRRFLKRQGKGQPWQTVTRKHARNIVAAAFRDEAGRKGLQMKKS